MDYEKKYKKALEKARAINNADVESSTTICEYIFPELQESKEHGLVFKKFNDNGFYKVDLDYLNKEQVEEIENIVKKWNPELVESEDERIRKWIKKELENKYVEDGIVNNVFADKAFAWLEKQKEQKPEWSEEDEKIITGIINDIQKRLEDCHLEQLADIYFKEIAWLKSLKQRIG